MTIQKLEEAKHLQAQVENYKKQLHLLHNSKIVGLQLRHFGNDLLITQDFPTGKIKVLLSDLYKEKIATLSAKIELL